MAEVTVIDEAPTRRARARSAGGMAIRSAWNLANGRRRPRSTPYYHFAIQPRSYPFDWHGWPGGVPTSPRASETRELSGLSGGGDLYESGLSPYTLHYPPLAHRGFRLPSQPLSGMWSDLSTNEKRLVGLAAAGGLALVLFTMVKRRRKRWYRGIVGAKRNPAPRRRGRRRSRR